jgi:hypothetical protein
LAGHSLIVVAREPRPADRRSSENLTFVSDGF